jgi:hypothetical protein
VGACPGISGLTLLAQSPLGTYSQQEPLNEAPALRALQRGIVQRSIVAQSASAAHEE